MNLKKRICITCILLSHLVLVSGLETVARPLTAIPKFDINSLLNSFSNCLLHLTTYEFHIIDTSPPKNRTEFVNDPVPFTFPIIISRNVINVKTTGLNLGQKAFINFAVDRYRTINRNVIKDGFHFSPRIHNKLCTIQYYLLSDVATLPPDFYWGLQFSLKDHASIIFPHAKYSDVFWTYKGSVPSFLKWGVYQMLLMNVEDPIFDELCQRWTNHVIDPYFVRWKTLANHFNMICVRLSPETKKTQDWFLTYAESRYFIAASEHNFYRLLQFSPNFANLRNEIDEMLTQITETTGCYWTGGSIHMTASITQELQQKMATATLEFAKDRTGFRHFKGWMLSDFLMFKLIFPNCTMAPNSNPNDRRIAGKIIFEEVWGTHMNFEEEALEFITCGGGESGYISLIGYISAFDKWIWIWLAISGFASAIFLRKIFKQKLRHSRKFVVDAIFMPLETFLEQGNGVHDIANRVSGVWLISTGWILAGIVLSNAYKGENITDLSAPIPPIRPTRFEHLIEKNFTVYTHAMGEDSLDFKGELGDLILFRRLVLGMILSNFSFQDKPFLTVNIITGLLEDADPKNQIVKKFKSIQRLVANLTAQDVYNITQKGALGFIEKIGGCDKTAFLGWSGEIERGRYILDDLLYHSGKKKMREFISRSEEHLLRIGKGWKFKDVRIVPPNFARPLSIVMESGIGSQWKMVEKFVKNLNLTKTVYGRSEKVLALTLSDNISVVFSVHGVLLVFAILVFILEHLLVLNKCSKKVSRDWGNPGGLLELLIVASGVTIIVIHIFLKPLNLNLLTLTVLALLCVVLSSSIVIDVIIFYNGKACVNLTNIVYQMDSRFTNADHMCWSSYIVSFKRELFNIYQRRRPDWTGLLLNYFVIAMNGSNLVNLTNWIFSLEVNVNETRRYIRKKKKTWFKDFFRELCKIFREETFSRMGLFLNYITISYSGTVILVPVALMLTPWQSDPIFLIVKLLFPAMEELTDNNFPIKLAINTGRYTVLLFQTQIIMLNFKAVVLLGFGLAASYLNQLRLLQEYVCGHNAIRKYSELLVAYNVVQVMISKMLGTFFTIGFIGLVCGTNLAVLSFKQGSTNLLILGVVGTIILFVAFQTTFFVGRSVFELSRGIINNWKIEVANKRDGGVLKRMVYCQSPILLSFGFIANATKESQINFMQDVFVNTCNILLLLPL
ncbi:unnamed protein product [Orchesella dallaii]|uniref:Uncharacterized protein n=1 Tax=Orchesella dallaii TaxID=48710 RepID=A0ABP1QVG5_9HEXA